jgi:small-conductance mechanosensitive channel
VPVFALGARAALAIAMLALAFARASSAEAQPSAPSAGSAAPKPPAPPGPEKAAPGSIPVPEVARTAEEVGRLIRDLETLLIPDPAGETAAQRLPEITARIAAQSEETAEALNAEPAPATLDGLTAQWQTTRGELVGYVNALARKATLTEEAIGRLGVLRDTWTKTRAVARESRAPAMVIDRIDGVLASIVSSQARVQDHRAATLGLQDRVAREVSQCEVMLERIADARLGATGRLFERDGVPLWHGEQLASALTELPERIHNAVLADLVQLKQFVRDQRWKLPVQGALFLCLMLLIRAARRRVHLCMSPGEVTPATVLVLGRSVSAALLLTVLLSFWIYTPPLPRTVSVLGQILLVVPALRIVRFLIDPRLMPHVVPRLYLLGLFFLADLVRHHASVVPVLEQQIFLLEMLAGVMVLGWRVWRWRRVAEPSEEASGAARVVRSAGVVILVAFAVALVAGAAGYMSLALLLGAGVLGNGYLAVVLYAGVRTADALVAFALHEPPLSYLAMVRRQRTLLEARAHGLLRWLAIGAWAFFALRYFGLWNGAVTTTSAALAATVRRGSVSISFADVLVFALTVGGAVVLSRILRFFLAEEVYPRLSLGRGLPEVLSGVVHYALLLVGFMLALAALGVDLTKITILAGALGVGIGFGLQNVVNNFVSGAIVLFERKINVGDAVRISDVEGRVQQMGMRACTVRTWDGAEVIVPNASLTSEKVVNWTLSDRLRRIEVAVGVAYGTPPEKALEILLGVARAQPHVLVQPAAVALFRGFGDSALQFEMQVWTDRFDLWQQTQSELAVALYAALREAGIEIPFPQREVRLRRDEEAALPSRTGEPRRVDGNGG